MTQEKSILVIFGATGDLAKRKLLPALFSLYKKNLLPETFKIFMCVSPRHNKSQQEFKEEAKGNVTQFSKHANDEEKLNSFTQLLHFSKIDFNDKTTFTNLKSFIEEATNAPYEEFASTYYLAAPTQFFGTIVTNLKETGLVIRERDALHNTKIIFEKPFGDDLASAQELNNLITQVFDERQIYRIDHYLGKELVQNILVLRFANTLFEHLWNNKHIEHVQITVAEDLGVENRASYYDKAGALRDIIQNHAIQLLALVAMESPVDLSAQGVRDEKVKLLKTIREIKPDQVPNIAVRGQYTPGTIKDRKVVGYREEERIASDSKTETYAALKLNIENWRWSGVPFYLRTGKRLSERTTEIAIVFKSIPVPFFEKDKRKVQANTLIIRVQPYEGITINFNTKVPGKLIKLAPVTMDFCHECMFGTGSPEAYERLIGNVLDADQTLFTRWDEVEQSWKIMQPILDHWKKDSSIPLYKAGTWGPSEAEELLAKKEHKWIVPTKPSYA